MRHYTEGSKQIATLYTIFLPALSLQLDFFYLPT